MTPPAAGRAGLGVSAGPVLYGQAQAGLKQENHTRIYHPRNVAGSVSQEFIQGRTSAGPVSPEARNHTLGVS